MDELDGVILVISCYKYLVPRVINNPYRLKGDSIAGWKIIYVVGDNTLNTDYCIGYERRIKSNLLILKCQDDYIHLFKKVVFAQQFVSKMYIIKKGIIKCDDDILFNKKLLYKYLSSPLDIDFSAKRYDDKCFKTPGPECCSELKRDSTIPQYFRKNAQHWNNLPKESKAKIDKYMYRGYINFPKSPEGYGGSGGVYFLSTKASKIIIEYFAKCNYDLFFEEENGAFPFIAEDVGTAFILCKNKIPFTLNNNLYSHIAWKVNENMDLAMAFHTHIHGQPLGALPPKVINLLSD